MLQKNRSQVREGEREREHPLIFFCAVADIPGLVAGAHENRGLGHSFLKHVQRCSVLLLVLDSASPQTSMAAQLRHLGRELELYDEQLLHGARLIVANKMDTRSDSLGCGHKDGAGTTANPSGRGLEDDLKALQEETGLPVIPISALKLWNIEPLKEALFRITKTNCA